MTIYFGLLHFMRYYVVFSSYLSQVVYFEEQVKMEEKEVQKGEKRNQMPKPSPKRTSHQCCACDGRHRVRDERHAKQPCDGRHTWCDERHTVPLLFWLK